mgnify:CR=1 FL=1
MNSTNGYGFRCSISFLTPNWRVHFRSWIDLMRVTRSFIRCDLQTETKRLSTVVVIRYWWQCEMWKATYGLTYKVLALITEICATTIIKYICSYTLSSASQPRVFQWLNNCQATIIFVLCPFSCRCNLGLLQAQREVPWGQRARRGTD